MLQDYLVDKDTGLPLSFGVISMYQDNSRTTYKNWYYQTGVPGNYTYITLPNPMTLSAVGTITDGNGNDVIPFYYPYSEVDNITPQPYYVTVDNSNGERQFTRQNFPFNPNSTPIGTDVDTLDNLITNSVFWRNIGSLNATTLLNDPRSLLLSAVIAPSQHDGFTMPDIQFIKSANGAVDTITFNNFVANFPNQILQNSVTPEYYLNFKCTGTGSETYKYIQIPVQLHVTALSGVQASFVLNAMAVSGSPNITISIYQYLGSGTTNPVVTLQTISLGTTWARYVVTFTTPSAQSLLLGAGGDDALFMQIGLPVGGSGICELNLAMPQFYLGDEVPTNDFQTYDEVNAIISSPRTGDFRTSLNTFQPFGWVGANDGTIGSGGSSSTNRSNADTWPLYQLIYNNFTNAFAPVSGGRTSNAYADFSANKTITLTRTLGRALIGANPDFYPSNTFTANTGTDILTLTTARAITVGTPIIVENSGGGLPSPLVADTVYFVSINSLTSTTVKLALTLETAYSGSADIDITTAGTGTQIIAGAAGAFVGESAHTQLLAELATHSHTAAGGSGGFVVPGGANNIYTMGAHGDIASISNTGSSTPFNVIQPSTYQNIFIKL